MWRYWNEHFALETLTAGSLRALQKLVGQQLNVSLYASSFDDHHHVTLPVHGGKCQLLGVHGP